MQRFNFAERIEKVKRYFRRTSKEEVMLLINEAIHKLGEVERRTDEIWNYVNEMTKKREKKVYVELIGEELDRISEDIQSAKELLNRAKGNIHLSQRKEYEIDLWI